MKNITSTLVKKMLDSLLFLNYDGISSFFKKSCNFEGEKMRAAVLFFGLLVENESANQLVIKKVSEILVTKRPLDVHKVLDYIVQI